ncbi:Retrovirus-related Pol polyprotein from transposon RE1, partial [Bienertia sinuspersici]
VKQIPITSWIIDTGAIDHICSNSSLFATKTLLSSFILISLPDGSVKTVSYVGIILLTSHITLKAVLYVPDFTHNLLFVSKFLEDNSLSAIFTSSSCLLQLHLTKKQLALGENHEGLFLFHMNHSHSFCSVSSSDDDSIAATDASNYADIHVLHARLRHPSKSKMEHLSSFLSMNSITDLDYESCVYAKFHKLPFPFSSLCF